MKAGITGLVTLGLICAATSLSAAPLDEQRVAQIAQAELKELGAPSSSVAIILGDRIVYAQAFGKAQLNPVRAATRADRYQVGSISKEFLATAILMLQEDGKLSLDDQVGKYLPELETARNVTLRQLLSHTSGIRDYWPRTMSSAKCSGQSLTHRFCGSGQSSRWILRPESAGNTATPATSWPA